MSVYKKTALKSAVALICVAAILAASVLLPMFQITIDKTILGQGIDISGYDGTEGKAFGQVIQQEGTVLLKNEDRFLPLDPARNPKLVLLGLGSAHMLYTGYGSGAGDATGAVTLKEGLEAAGFQVCQELYDFYDSRGTTGNQGSFNDVGVSTSSGEIDPAAISDSVKQAAFAYSDTAIYVLSRVGAENGVMGASDLALSAYEEATLDLACENFENVIVLLNLGNQFEVGFIDGAGVSRNSGESFHKYAGKIKAALWIGAPGLTGTYAIGQILAGQINPSGRLADTFAYNVFSSPAGNNYFAQKFTDLTAAAYCNYIEGIYVGYQWYETAAFEGAIDYSDYTGTPSTFTDGTVPMGVQYPFGYGLSYTSFQWEIAEGTTADGSTLGTDPRQEITVRVKVTNTGTVAGKDVVQLYVTAPYTDGGIEKAYVSLVGFAKTGLLEPGASEVVTVTLTLDELASYDWNDANKNNFSGYELEKGEYKLRAMRDAHSWADGSDLVLTYQVAQDIRYETSASGYKIENQFPDLDGGIEYLSRAGGFANGAVAVQTDHAATDYTDGKGNTDYVKTNFARRDTIPAGEVNNYTKGKDYEVDLGWNKIMFRDMIGVDYDDPRWDTFISQLSKSEMAELIAYGSFQTAEVERLGIPYTSMADGPSAIKSTFADGTSCVLYPCEVVIAATWNQELAYEVGQQFGRDMEATGVSGWYAPSVNIHRTPFNGRNYEYYSEDAVLSGIVAAEVTKGAQDKGAHVFVKHLLLYCDGASTGYKWCTEQALRQIYLKPFQIAIEDGNAMGLMTSNSFDGIVFVGCSKELLTNVIRGEFGFQGMITTDAATANFWLEEGLRAGNDIWLSFDNSRRTALVKEENIGIMQQACKNILWTIAQSEIACSASVQQADWSPSMVAMIAVDVLAAGGLALCVWSLLKNRKRLAQAQARPGEKLSAVLLAVSCLLLFASGALFIMTCITFNVFAETYYAFRYSSIGLMIVSAAGVVATLLLPRTKKQ